MVKELFYYNANGMWLIAQSMAGKCSVSDFLVCPLLKKHNLEHLGSITCHCYLALSPSHPPKNQKGWYSLCLYGKQVWSLHCEKEPKSCMGFYYSIVGTLKLVAPSSSLWLSMPRQVEKNFWLYFYLVQLCGSPVGISNLQLFGLIRKHVLKVIIKEHVLRVDSVTDSTRRAKSAFLSTSNTGDGRYSETGKSESWAWWTWFCWKF